MNIKKSLKVAMAKNGYTAQDVANKMNVSRTRIYAITNQVSPRNETIERLSEVFGMKVSEFISLGE